MTVAVSLALTAGSALLVTASTTAGAAIGVRCRRRSRGSLAARRGRWTSVAAVALLASGAAGALLRLGSVVTGAATIGCADGISTATTGKAGSIAIEGGVTASALPLPVLCSSGVVSLISELSRWRGSRSRRSRRSRGGRCRTSALGVPSSLPALAGAGAGLSWRGVAGRGERGGRCPAGRDSGDCGRSWRSWRSGRSLRSCCGFASLRSGRPWGWRVRCSPWRGAGRRC